MKFIDTHSHLFADQFSEDIDEVLKRARENSVTKIILPNIDKTSVPKMMNLSKKYPELCFPTIGLHPCDVGSDFCEVLKEMKALLATEKIYAIGETGIDLHWDKTTLGIQKKALIEQINWAKEFKLPIIIHARESYDELFEVFDQHNDEKLKGIFHCFTGTPEQAKHIIGYGNFKLGIGGVVTFKNSGLDKTVAEIGADHLVLETDAPYLAPTPHRGKRNESSYLYLIASKLSEILEADISDIARITTENALEIFDL